MGSTRSDSSGRRTLGHLDEGIYIPVGALEAPDQPMKHDRFEQRAKSEDRYHFQLIIDVP